MSEPVAEPAGVLLVDKPRGITSHDVVDSVRRLYRTRRVGLPIFDSGLTGLMRNASFCQLYTPEATGVPLGTRTG